MGLGNNKIDKISVIGESPEEINLHCETKKSPVIFFDQLFRKSFVEKIVF